MVQEVQVIGLDGCDPVLLSRWMKEGVLPTLSKIVENGIFSPLRSTTPPTTFPAWISMFTGKKPGNLGVFDFFDMKKTDNGYKQSLYTTKRWSGDYVWNIAGQQDLNVGIINIPFFTPDKIKGYMLDLHMGSSYPSTFLKDITSTMGTPKSFNPNILPIKKDEIQRIKENTLLEFEIGKKLRDRIKTELFIQVFNVLDSTAHCTSNVNTLKDRYILVDKLLKKYFDFNEKNTLFVSDHGMKKMRKRFYLNRWLIDAGFLKLGEEYEQDSLSLLNSIAYKFLDIFPSFEFLFEDILSRFQKTKSSSKFNTEKVDWDKTTVYSHSSNATGVAGIWINDKGEKVREKILSEFRKFKETSGKDLINKISLREEVYTGTQLETLPHVIIELFDDVLAMAPFSPVQSRSTSTFAHAYEGIFMGVGPDISRDGALEIPHISDIAPTILNLLELPIPENIDGKFIPIN